MSIRHGPHDYNYKATFIDREDYTRVEHEYTRGKVLGGSTAVNYYTWLRGSAATIDEWKQYGGENWSYENTKAYFDKPATYHDDKGLFPKSLFSIGDQGGPIHIAHPQPLPEIEAWRNSLEKAWVSKGGELSVDVYHGEQKGVLMCRCRIRPDPDCQVCSDASTRYTMVFDPTLVSSSRENQTSHSSPILSRNKSYSIKTKPLPEYA